MELLHEETILCPYCNESIVILIDKEDVEHEYVEDCSVCCQPIRVSVSANIDEELFVNVRDENEA